MAHIGGESVVSTLLVHLIVHWCRQYNDMCAFFGKPKKLERVNVAARMEELGLDLLFDSESWPDAAPLRELSTKIKNLTGEGFSNPHVFAELRK